MAFSASDAAFEGFRVVRREPASVSVWAALQLFVGVVVTAMMLPMLRDFTAVRAAAGVGQPAGAAQLAALGDLGWLYLLILPAYLVLMSVYTAAVYRAVLRPADQGLGRLKLSGDELRLAGLWLLMGLLFLGGTLVAGIVIGVFVALTRGGGAASGLIAVLAYLCLMAACIWLSVRLSLAGPMTFAEKRIRLFSSWRLTRGRFWPLFGCYLLAWVFMVLIVVVDFIVGAAVSAAMGGASLGNLAAMFRPDFSSVSAYYTPARLATMVIGAAFGAVIWTVAIAAPAQAYREIAGGRPEDQAETFA